MAVKLSALRAGRCLILTNIIFIFLVLIFVRSGVNPSASGRIKKTDKIIDYIGSRIHELPSFSVMRGPGIYSACKRNYYEEQKNNISGE
jgi:hypothetical protein